MLRPAVQPGSTTGYTLPDEEVSLDLVALRTDRGDHAGRERSPRATAKPADTASGFTVTPKERQPVPLEISLATGGQTTLEVVLHDSGRQPPARSATAALPAALGAARANGRRRSPSATSPS